MKGDIPSFHLRYRRLISIHRLQRKINFGPLPCYPLVSPKPCFIAGGALGGQRAWQLADESGPVRPGAAPRVPSVPAAGVHGDAHAEVLAGGEGVEAVAAEGGERGGRVVPESKVMHDRMAVNKELLRTLGP